jgi:hypothetical protein
LVKIKEDDMEDLKDLLDYDPETGKLFWKKRDISMFMFDPQRHSGKRCYSAERACNKWNTRYAGKEAMATLNNWGYLHGGVNGRSMLAHRAIWEIVTGRPPEQQMDHINGDKTDNRLINLREVTPSFNTSNRGVPINNSSGVIGVCWNAGRKRWQAQIRLGRKQHHLGLFKSRDEALRARRAAEIALNFASRERSNSS